MNDQDLLTLAAKAAGIVIIRFRLDDAMCRDVLVANSPRNPCSIVGAWNPLTDDGDALRLAVKVLSWPHGGRAFDNAVTAMFAVGKLPDDAYAATRRAIVLAAANIGRTM